MPKDKQSLLFDSNVWSSSPKVDNAVEYLTAEIKTLGIRERWHPHYADHIKLIILNFYNIHVNAPSLSVAYWRSKNLYSDTQHYNATKLSFRAMMFIVEALSEKYLGYLDASDVGYLIRGKAERSYISRMKATPKLIELLANQFEFTAKVLERHPDEQLIILKDKVEEEVRITTGKFKTRTVMKKIPYEDNEEITLMRLNLREINNMLERHFIGLCTNDESIAKLRNRLINNKNDDEEAYPKVLDYSRLKLKRIFNNGTFDNGGRFYGGWWQALPSKDDPNPIKGEPKENFRRYIRIDNVTTVERDFSGMQVCML